ncbi:MAG: hypothetical protein CMJ81_18400 [Planctomycetaceae bacterium]|nr:hypothetical protein [Planctomycetaceae bacterium]
MSSSAIRILLLTVFTLVISYGTHCAADAPIVSISFPFVSPNSIPNGEINTKTYITRQDRYHRYRIPGAVVSQDGTILAFAEGRRGLGGDPRTEENAPIDMVMRRSTDNGQTWEPQVVIDPGFRPNGEKVDFGDPTPVFDAETETVFLLYGQFSDIGSDSPPTGQSPRPADGHHVVWVRASTDNGKTWSQRKQIVYPDEPRETSDGLYWRIAHPGPGNGIQLQWQDRNKALNGRLVIPAKRNGSKTPDGPVETEPFVFYSDDHGKSWQVGKPTLGPGGNEDEVVELTDGQLLLDARQNSGLYRRRHLSRDGGQTWGPNVPDTTRTTPVDGSLARYSAKRAGHDRDRLLFSLPQGTGRILARAGDAIDKGLTRNNITVWISYDEGRTFIHPVRINYEASAYSVILRLADGSVGLFVETAGETGFAFGDITLYRFGVDALENPELHAN